MGATVTGKLIGINDQVQLSGPSVDIQLCGYGSQFPRGMGEGGDTGSFADVEMKGITPSLAGGAFEVSLVGNDVIVPAGTYYTITTRNANGDILQTNAYVFTDGNVYDLANTPPFDPTEQPTPPIPPILVNQLLIIPSSPTPNFPGDQFTTWGLLLSEEVTSSTVSGLVAGNLYTFIITQDRTGGWPFVWPTNVLNATPVNQDPSGITIQTFVAYANGNAPLLPIGGATYYP